MLVFPHGHAVPDQIPTSDITAVLSLNHHRLLGP